MAEYYAPNAKKRWCVSLYGSGRQTTGVFPQVYYFVVFYFTLVNASANLNSDNLVFLILMLFLCPYYRMYGTVKYVIVSRVEDLVCNI